MQTCSEIVLIYWFSVQKQTVLVPNTKGA